MPAPPLRIVMVGTKDFALPTFQHLLDEGFHFVALVTQPERPQGRNQQLIPSAIKQAARARGIPVEQPESINDPQFVERLRRYQPDILVTAAYGQILSPEVLSVPRLGGINLHASILPAYRGAAPVARAIEHGETETGVTVIQMTPKIDAGGILSFARTPIDPDETAGALESRLAVLGAPLIARALDDLASGKASVLPQDKSRVSRAPKLTTADTWIDWTLPASRIHNLVRAMQPAPVARSDWQPDNLERKPVQILIHESAVAEGDGGPGLVLGMSDRGLLVAAGRGALALRRVQIPGKRVLPIAEILRGHDVTRGRFVTSAS
jgi:methionyl-tRNA formyltransferase